MLNSRRVLSANRNEGRWSKGAVVSLTHRGKYGLAADFNLEIGANKTDGLERSSTQIRRVGDIEPHYSDAAKAPKLQCLATRLTGRNDKDS